MDTPARTPPGNARTFDDLVHEKNNRDKESAGGVAGTVWVLMGIYLFWTIEGAHFLSWQAAVYFLPLMFLSAFVFGGLSFAIATGLQKLSWRLPRSIGPLLNAAGGMVIFIGEYVLMFFAAQFVVGALLSAGQQAKAEEVTDQSAHVIPLTSEVSGKLLNTYLSNLDLWVNRGGKIGDVQTSVVQNCGKLVMIAATPAEAVAFLKERRDDFDFRVDVCAKLTVTRSHPQPDFDKPEVKRVVCGDMAKEQPVFATLCTRAGIK